MESEVEIKRKVLDEYKSQRVNMIGREKSVFIEAITKKIDKQ